MAIRPWGIWQRKENRHYRFDGYQGSWLGRLGSIDRSRWPKSKEQEDISDLIINLEKSIRRTETRPQSNEQIRIESHSTITWNGPAMMIDTFLDMIMGMILGMVVSPIMMKGIKIIRQRRKVDRILREILQEKTNKVSLSHGTIH